MKHEFRVFQKHFLTLLLMDEGVLNIKQLDIKAQEACLQ
jgi:hypothetical protein